MAAKNKPWIVFICALALLCVLNGAEETKTTRTYLATGNWYPPNAADLNSMLDQFFGKAQAKELPGKIVGLIGPHAGFSYSGQCMANAYKSLQNPSLAGNIERVILMGVSHRAGFYGAVVSSFDFDSTPLGSIPMDTSVAKELAKEKFFRVNDRAIQYEHSIENHLPFLQRALKGKTFKVVPILFGSLDKKDFKTMAAAIKKYVDDKTLVIASTDLTHYGANFDYTPFKTDLEANLTKLDMGIITPITRLDFDDYFEYRRKTGITMCGFAPVGVLMEMFADKAHKATLIDYYKSGDRNKDYTLSVSYASIIISETKGGKKTMTDTAIKQDESPAKLTKQEQKVLLRIARDTLDQYIENGALAEDLEKKYEISANLEAAAGVFVTLRKKGDLRGCIGSIVGTEPLYLGVQGNAVKSAVRDPRFSPVKKAELDDIDIEISVMTPLQPLDDYKKIRLGTDGVIIKKGYYQAVYLPQVATETGWNLGQFLGSLCQKAGLPSNSYLPAQNKDDEKMEFLIFQAQVFGEK